MDIGLTQNQSSLLNIFTAETFCDDVLTRVIIQLLKALNSHIRTSRNAAESVSSLEIGSVQSDCRN